MTTSKENFFVPLPRTIGQSRGLRLGDKPTIITKEKGTGRDLIARQILKEALTKKFGRTWCITEGIIHIDSNLSILVSETIDGLSELLPRALITEYERLPEEGYLIDTLYDRPVVVLLGKSAGVIYGAYTLAKLMKPLPDDRISVLAVIDYPSIKLRGINPAMAWYLGSNFEGPYTPMDWGLEKWKRFIDFLTEFRYNALFLCMYGLWPFRLPGYDHTIAENIVVDKWIGDKIVHQGWTHPNIQDEFFGEMVEYAHRRGMKVIAYMGLNTYNGWVWDQETCSFKGYLEKNPEFICKSDSAVTQGEPALCFCWSAEKAIDYVSYVSGYLLDHYHFDGVVYESAEEEHIMCSCDRCRANYGEDKRKARISGDAALINRYYEAVKDKNPEAYVGFLPHHTFGCNGNWPSDLLVEENVRLFESLIPEGLHIHSEAPNQVELLQEGHPKLLELWGNIFGRNRIVDYIIVTTGGWRPAVQLRLDTIDKAVRDCLDWGVSQTICSDFDLRPNEPAYLWLSEYNWLGFAQKDLKKRVSGELFGGKDEVFKALLKLEEASYFALDYDQVKPEILDKKIPLSEVKRMRDEAARAIEVLKEARQSSKPDMLSAYDMVASMDRAILVGEGLRLYVETLVDYYDSRITSSTLKKVNQACALFSEAYGCFPGYVRSKFMPYRELIQSLV